MVGIRMENSELKLIGQRIALRRKELNLTQEKIAELMNVSVQMVSNLERGNKAIRIENLINLSKILNVSCDYILLGKHTNNDLNIVAEKLKLLSDEDLTMVNMIIDYKTNLSS